MAKLDALRANYSYRPLGKGPKMSKKKDIVRAIKKNMSKRQLFALGHAVLQGHQNDAQHVRFIERLGKSELRANSDWFRRLVFDFNGGPEMIGPCWHTEVWIEDENSHQINVFSWQPKEQQQGKIFALTALERVGRGEQVDVRVEDASLHVWRRATVLEAVIAAAVRQ